MKKEAMFYNKLDDKKVQCFLCAHHCMIQEYKYGICGVRQNEDGVLYTHAFGEVVASHVDPVEKKPLYHFLPGTETYSIATAGCNFRCGFCQNWQISQVSQRKSGSESYELKPEDVVREAKKNECKSISYTYTEPTVFFEYAYETAKIAKKEGLYNIFVTNGYMSKEALDAIGPYLDAANVDLKSSKDQFYKRNCGASVQPVLDSIAYMKKLGIWVEVTTLIIPSENDGHDNLRKIANFIQQVGRDVPWHLSRFHPDYKFTGYPATPQETLAQAARIGQRCGLKYVYLGNVPEGSDTRCRKCNRVLITRSYFSPGSVKIKDGKCSSCLTPVEGVWGS